MSSAGKFRKEGKEGLGRLEELDAGSVPDNGGPPAIVGSPGTPDHLAAEPDPLASSAEMHVEDRPRCEGRAVLDEEAGRADVQGLQRAVP